MQLEEQFKVLPHEQKKLSASAKQKPKVLNVLDLKVARNNVNQYIEHLHV